MLKASELLRQGRTEDLWQMCCGFLDLTIDEFMAIQERLLMRQIDLLAECPLGKRLMKGRKPESIDEFRRIVPITTYRDYTPELSEKREDVLPAKPEMWIHSSGWSDEYSYKWVPASRDFVQELSYLTYGVGLLSCCKGRGIIPKVPKIINILYSVAPRPYMSGTLADVIQLQTPIRYLPDVEESRGLSFEERIKKGLELSLEDRMDYFFGLSLVLKTVGDKFVESSGKTNLVHYLKQPKSFMKITRGYLKSRLKKRSLLPKDIWNLKGIITSGVDSSIYREQIEHMWGRSPLDIYSCTEGGIIATQAWDYSGMTFVPNTNFLEFLPEDEQVRLDMDSTYMPRTLLLSEVRANQSYELIITNFHGGVMTRYRIGDMVTITSLTSETTGIQLPQMAFERRVDSHIDFYFVRLSERSIWKALESCCICYEDWFAYKDPGSQELKLYLELKESNGLTKNEVSERVRKALVQSSNAENVDDNLANMTSFSTSIEFLPRGTFERYRAMKQSEGADLAHLKPPHINPPAHILETLININCIQVNPGGSSDKSKRLTRV